MLATCAKNIGIALALLAITACGDGDAGDSTDAPQSTLPTGSYAISTEVGDGLIAKLDSGSATLIFGDETAGQQYVIMPYHLGNIDTVNGAGIEKATFTLTPSDKNTDTAASLTTLSNKAEQRLTQHHLSSESLTRRIAKLRASILNRFNSQIEYTKQNQDMLSLVNQHDQLQAELVYRLALKTHQPTMQSTLKNRIKARKNNSYKNSIRLTAGQTFSQLEGCVAADEEVPIPPAENEETETALSVVAGDGYCIVYTFDDPATDTKANIEASIASFMATYKTKVYADTFPAKSNFVFRPYFIFTSFDALPDAYKVLNGLLDGDMTAQEGVPVLYLPHDISEVVTDLATGATKEINEANRLEMHATLVHEAQHGIMYYYKSGSDILYIDEGLAHYFESAFGYRDTGNFANYAFPYLQLRSFGTSPFLNSAAFLDSNQQAGTASLNDSYSRGAGESFFHYLVGQKGGITYTDGQISGGDGLTFLRSVVQSTNKGLKNIATIYADATLDWLDLNGNFLGALLADNSGLASVPAKFTNPAKITTVTDSLGQINKIFGLRFNGEDELGAAHTSVAQTKLSTTAATTMELFHYHTSPQTFDVSAAANKIVIASDATSAAVSVVRIQ